MPIDKYTDDDVRHDETTDEIKPDPALVDATLLHEDSLGALINEVGRARYKFPNNKHLTVALGEEFGELCNALLERQGAQRIKAEALQVACVAMRIYEEGDLDFLRPDVDEHE